MKKHSGFTLIELMVVMAIIAILATAGLTAYSNYLKKARDSARAQTARQMMTKVEELANGGLPPSPAALKAFLIAENFAPLRSGGLDLDPLHGGESCWGSLGRFNSICVFTYTKVSDGTYYISYPVEHPDNAAFAWFINSGGFNSFDSSNFAGNIIGTNPYFTDANYATYGGWELDLLNGESYNYTLPTVEQDIMSFY